MSADPIAILFGANAAFFRHVGVALASAAVGNRRHRLDVHLITVDRDRAEERKLRETAAAFANVRLSIHHLDDAPIARWHADRHISKEAYLRILAPAVLPEALDRALYLDSDLVVLGDLMPLWQSDLGGRPLGAVPDILTQPPRAALGIAREHAYVNSGVLLIDLAAWRRRGLTDELVRFIERQGSMLEYHDQDAINAVLQGEVHLLDFRWNLQTRHLRFGRRILGDRHAAIRRAARAPAVIHYAGAAKPWMFRARTARKRDYHRFAAMTAWGDAAPPLATGAERAEYAMDRLLSRAGIDYLQVLYLLGRVPGRLGEEIAARIRPDGPRRAER